MRKAFVMGALVLAAIGASSTAARAGGGTCPEPKEPGTGPRVTLFASCFDPGTLWTEAGETVTFTNDDEYEHTVTGTGIEAWGIGTEPLAAGESVKVTFDEVGVYPYTCIFHPGMNGAIVVGDGIGSGGVPATDPVEPAADTTTIDAGEGIPASPVATGVADGPGAWPLVAAGTGLMGIALGLGAGRIRRRPTP